VADQVHIPKEAPGPASKPSSAKAEPQFGLTAAMALIVGSIIGVGVFNLPTSLGIPVYLSQRRHMTPPGPVPAYG
jgi:APA family basic amino acid/polyamine antiporter